MEFALAKKMEDMCQDILTSKIERSKRCKEMAKERKQRCKEIAQETHNFLEEFRQDLEAASKTYKKYAKEFAEVR